LDEKPSLKAGRVTVVLRQEVEVTLPKDDPFWQRMQAMWAIPTGRDAGDSGESSLAEVRAMREEWDEHQLAIEGLQDESGMARKSPENPNP
jgi:predicted NUDIX family NTP pyrophosphohydrolase